MPSLYIVATPIGNLEDISARALRVLSEAGVIVAEDTRVARALLNRFDIHGKRLLSYNEHNRVRRIPEVLDLLATNDAALVTDAGTPAISDPGVELVTAAREAGYAVVAVPGPSAVVAALSVAGLRVEPFCFTGFLPRQAGELRTFLEAALARPDTLVAFEAPQRLPKTLALLAELAPQRRLAVCRELTKLHEEVFTGTAAAAQTYFQAPRGEIVIVIEGAAPSRREPAGAGEDIEAEVRQMRALGLSRAQATALLASRHGINRRRAYALWLQAGDATR